MRTVRARIEVLDQGGARFRPVALPQLNTAYAVTGGEEEHAAHFHNPGRPHKPGRHRTVRARKDILDEHGARLRPVALPQLRTVQTVMGGAGERARHVHAYS